MTEKELKSAIDRVWPNGKYYAKTDGLNLPWMVNKAGLYIWINMIDDNADTELIRSAAKLYESPGFIEFTP